MSRTKDLYMDAHEAEMEAFLEANPEATDEEAYEATSEAAYFRMNDRFADMADHYRQLKKDGML